VGSSGRLTPYTAAGVLVNIPAFQANDNVAIGVNSNPGNGGTGNVSAGDDTLQNLAIGIDNVALGLQAGQSLTGGGGNVFVGFQAGQGTIDGNDNFYMGYQAGPNNPHGHDNVFLGEVTGTNATGSGNVLIGGDTGTTLTTTSNGVAVGFGASISAAEAMALGVNTRASAAGSVAIGTSSVGSGAQATTTNTIQLGTAVHTTKTAKFSSSGGITAGALPAVVLASGVGSQIVVGRNVQTHTPVTYTPTAGAAATCLVELSPDNVTYSALGTQTVPAGVALAGFVLDTAVAVPDSWWLRLTVTNAALGATTYH
jgi:hypothetical protein